MSGENLFDIRKDYGKLSLSQDSVDKNPFQQFEAWFGEAKQSEGNEVNAFVLSTVASDGMPEGRVVLLKYYDENGFTFFTNYNSHKAQQLETNPVASMTFYWRSLERQVRIKGHVRKIDSASSDKYFKARPLESQKGAWASPQSQIIDGKSFLEESLKEIDQKFEKEEIVRPDFWGGYQISPISFEFWQGRPSRLHDRIRYDLEGSDWKINRLAP